MNIKENAQYVFFHSFTAYCCSVAILCLHEQYQILDIFSFLPKWIFFGVMLLIGVPVAIGYVAGMLFSIIGILIVVRNYYYEFFYEKKMTKWYHLLLANILAVVVAVVFGFMIDAFKLLYDPLSFK